MRSISFVGNTSRYKIIPCLVFPAAATEGATQAVLDGLDDEHEHDEDEGDDQDDPLLRQGSLLPRPVLIQL